MKTVVKACISKNDKYLILLRSKNERPMPLHWDFAGGKLEEDENSIAGLKREVLEETSLEIDNCILDKEFATDIEGKPFFFKIYTIKLVSDEKNLKLNHEYQECRWATRDEIAKLKINPFLKKYLDI